MSEDSTAGTTPLHLRGRDAVIAASTDARWRDGAPPDYRFSREVMPGERTVHHTPGSLADVVEQLVQVFEMELSYKSDPAQWVSMVSDRIRVSMNGGPAADSAELAERGSYNVLIGENPYYSAAAETFESSHETFHRAFPGGFFWEVLEVYSPPPVIAFKWRHWGTFDGPYQGHQPTGERMELFGVTVARCAPDLRLLAVENFYDNTTFLGRLAGADGPGTGGHPGSA
ncbi:MULTISPECIES: SnoaL-like polyketide cyclase [Parafrankia]|uniref:SnoaL-like polyketide cyclase n=1 Tax=Parafrankia soli TaxID=2599596 RepID=A0A1S1Q3P6_9ACTN|nr:MULTISPECIES: SnoaL-like polyketide cyclase [Parafrankia]OHV27815.1 SnoaL-like polyketide cyclase [Parafrankia soli]TCJ32369.1 SnoaL-like polyketide cyclase [Parafrankia sp. BMG5.11]